MRSDERHRLGSSRRRHLRERSLPRSVAVLHSRAARGEASQRLARSPRRVVQARNSRGVGAPAAVARERTARTGRVREIRTRPACPAIAVAAAIVRPRVGQLDMRIGPDAVDETRRSCSRHIAAPAQWNARAEDDGVVAIIDWCASCPGVRTSVEHVEANQRPQRVAAPVLLGVRRECACLNAQRFGNGNERREVRAESSAELSVGSRRAAEVRWPG